jgi:hypothetical protein
VIVARISASIEDGASECCAKNGLYNLNGRAEEAPHRPDGFGSLGLF